MVATTVAGSVQLPALIPEPHVIRYRLYELRTESQLLRRLLRIAEDKKMVLPTRGQEGAPNGTR